MGSDCRDFGDVISGRAQSSEEYQRAALDDTFVGSGVGQLDGLIQGLHGGSPWERVNAKRRQTTMDMTPRQ